MKSLDALIDHLNKDEKVKAFKRIETIVHHNPEYLKHYQNVLEKQKQLVKSEHANHPKQAQYRTAYEEALNTLKNYPVVHQYLMLQAEINEDIQMMTDLIERAINKPFTSK